MSDSHTSPPTHAEGHGLLHALVVRVYALVLLTIVVYLVYLAFAFLFRSVFQPQLTSADFLNRPLHLTASDLRALQSGAADAPPAVAPLNHFHDLGPVMFTHPRSGCTTSGCHAPLPHKRDKATRAFANFHAAFLDCAVCHQESEPQAGKLCWVDAQTGERQDEPALLQLAAIFEAHADAAITSNGPRDTLVRGLLMKIHDEFPQDELIAHLHHQLEFALPQSPVHQQAVRRLRDALAQRDRGEYGAVIAPDPAAQPGWVGDDAYLRQARTTAAQAPYAAEKPQADPALHAGVIAKPDACLACHEESATGIDYRALGYPPQRAAALRSMPLGRMVQQIREGQPFYLPQILENGRD
jgi:hypothetical protein